MSNQPTANVGVGKYVWIMIGCQVGIAIVAGVIAAATDWQPGSYVGIAAIFASLAVAMQKFVGDHHRAPDKAERKQFTLWVTFANFLMPIPAVLLAMQSPELAGTEASVLLAIFAVVFAILMPILGVAVYFASGSMAQSFLRNQEAKAA